MLVGGLRYTRRPRQYPDRDQDPFRLMEELTSAGSVEREAFRALVSTSAGTPLKLSGFQARAARTILGSVGAGRSSGAIVGAGTGSGKTLAFYLPALTHLAGEIGPNHRLLALALYPRNELLRDQLQTGVEQVLRINKVVHERAGRPLRIGALFGGVPQTVRALTGRFYGTWRRQADAFVCPYLSCPGESGQGCGGQLVVRLADAEADEPALQCTTCNSKLDPGVFPVTRDQLRRRPPDILYSSTEMLNRSLLDPSISHVLGLDTKPGPDLVLLDEVHTYGGTSGAMTSLAIRRWRNRVRSKPVFVGLSATLLDAPQFFGDLVGLHADQIADIAPDPDELVPEGAEYQIVVRGDPTSGVGLLSTTIQTAMLLGRAMDAPHHRRSAGLFGRKVFAFTDDLDVTNRLYFDLLDAEGQRHRSRGAHLAYRPSLAHLRSPSLGDAPARRRAGQVWDLAIATGHGLGASDRLRVGRTSSQDTGLDTAAQVVVATASLEVGVDDPEVGAVLQHKAPRGNAAFLQRQGRAGRERGMRPLTVVVLSDYGRDRHAYEAWDQLLSPVLRATALPVRNVHVLRMQAVLATLEWAIVQAGADVRGRNMWTTLAGPPRHDRDLAAQRSVAQRLRQAIDSDGARASLVSYLQQSLALEKSVVEDLLWQPPRPVLLAAVPALLRRIEDKWEMVDEREQITAPARDGDEEPSREDAGARQPLPAFVPPTLFSPLALPDVLVDMPRWSADNEGKHATESLGLVQALRELAPGRVTKRFAINSDLDRAWVPVHMGGTDLEISTFVTLSQSEGDVNTVPLVRPLRMQVQQPAEDVRDSTHGFPRWETEVRPQGPGTELRVGDRGPLAPFIVAMEAHLHRDQQQVEVRRGMTASEVSIVEQGGEEHRAVVALSDHGSPVALGGAFDVDGLRFEVDVTIPDEVWGSPFGPSLRAGWFEERLKRGLSDLVNPFLGNWIHDIILTGLLRGAIDDGLELNEAWDRMRPRLASGSTAALEILLAAPGLDLEELDPEARTGKLIERVRGALQDPTVTAQLDNDVPALWESPGADAQAWLRRRLVRTIGEVLLGGAALLCPEHDPELVLLDIEPDADAHGVVWLTESTVGGGGFLEAVTDAVTANPARFLRLASAALRPGTQETVAAALHEVVQLAVRDERTAQAFDRYRTSRGARERTARLGEVRSILRDEGVPDLPDVVGAMATRLLRPGSTGSIDKLVVESLERWVAAERQLGVEISLRTWCFLDAWTGDEYDLDRLDHLQLVLWPRGSRTRDHNMASYNPFTDEPDPAAGVLELAMKTAEPAVVNVAEPDLAWREAVERLEQDGYVRLRAPHRRRSELLDVVARSATDEVELDVLRIHPKLVNVSEATEAHISVDLELPELGSWLRSADRHGSESPPRARVRRLMTAGSGPSAEVEQLLQLFFASEFVLPSQPLWIVSAWLSDMAVLDNRGGELLSIAPGLSTRRLGIIEVVTEIVLRGGDVRVVVREDPHNRSVVARLRELEGRTTPGTITVEVRPDLHDKLLVSDRLVVEGSMNLTHRGATRNEEGVRVVGEPDDVATQRVELSRRFWEEPPVTVLEAFFGVGNDLRLDDLAPQARSRLEPWLERWRSGVGPAFLPRVKDGALYWYGLARDPVQRREIQDLLVHWVGPACSDAVARRGALDFDDPFDADLAKLLPDRVLRLGVWPRTTATTTTKDAVRKRLEDLVKTLDARPPRKRGASLSLASMLDDLDLAATAGDSKRASELLVDLEERRLLDAPNTAFVRVRVNSLLGHHDDVVSSEVLASLDHLRIPAGVVRFVARSAYRGLDAWAGRGGGWGSAPGTA